MTEDQLEKIKADVDKRYAIFDAKRRKIYASYAEAKTPERKLRMLAKALRHHHSYMADTLLSGWYVESLKSFAGAIDDIADELEVKQ